jgi:tetratricopeptide (TPR) repeat protein
VDLATSLNNLAALLHDEGKYDEAERLCREALEIRCQRFPRQNHRDIAQGLNNLAAVLRAQGKYTEAEPLFREALEMRRQLSRGQATAVLALSLMNLAAVLHSQKKYTEGGRSRPSRLCIVSPAFPRKGPTRPRAEHEQPREHT